MNEDSQFEEQQFIERWNDYLEGDLDELGVTELRGLLAGDDRRLKMAVESYQIHRLLGLVAEDSVSRQDEFVRQTMAALPAEKQDFVRSVMQRVESVGKLDAPSTRTIRSHVWSLVAVAAAAVIAVSFFAFAATAEPEILRIAELDGSVQWTGDGGHVIQDLSKGSSLRGGTIESLSSDSWAVLEFRDGSTVTIAGQTMLTVSQRQQKELRLRRGILSAEVKLQPTGRPMLIHTPTAKLEVLGTQLNVDAQTESTTLTVNSGRVRVTRLADGDTAEVSADHQVVASLERRTDFKVMRRSEPVHRWKSELPDGATFGRWLAESGGSLRTTPLLLEIASQPVTLYLNALSVSRAQGSVVVLTPRATFRVRLRMDSAGEVHFGLTTNHAKGGFAGKYVATRAFEATSSSNPVGTNEFMDVELRLEDFHPLQSEFPGSPIGLELVDWWCCSYNVDLGVAVSGVELVPQQRDTQPGL